jgi:hypothetical protein
LKQNSNLIIGENTIKTFANILGIKAQLGPNKKEVWGNISAGCRWWTFTKFQPAGTKGWS